MNRTAFLRRKIANLQAELADAEETLTSLDDGDLQAHTMHDMYDLNQDGFIDESEWGGSPAIFNSLDTDMDGYLTPEEISMGIGQSFGTTKLASRRAAKHRGLARRKLAGASVTSLVKELVGDAVAKVISVNRQAAYPIREALFGLGLHPTDQNIIAMFDLVDTLNIPDAQKNKMKDVIKYAFLKVQESIQHEYYDKFEAGVPLSVQREIQSLGLDFEHGEDFKKELRELDLSDSPDLAKQLRMFDLELGPTVETKKEISMFNLNPTLETKKQLGQFTLDRLASRRRAHGVFNEYDLNQDGFIDAQEWGGSPDIFNQLDLDGDVMLSLDEVNSGLGESFGLLADEQEPTASHYSMDLEDEMMGLEDPMVDLEDPMSMDLMAEAPVTKQAKRKMVANLIRNRRRF